MKILISGANGYIGQRLISVLLEQGHLVHCLVRNRRRFEVKENPDKIQVQEIDFLEVDDRDRFNGQNAGKLSTWAPLSMNPICRHICAVATMWKKFYVPARFR